VTIFINPSDLIGLSIRARLKCTTNITILISNSGDQWRLVNTEIIFSTIIIINYVMNSAIY